MPTGLFRYTYSVTTGQLTTLAAPDVGTLAYSYDGALVTSEAWGGPLGAVAGSVSRTYDSDFRVASESVNGVNPVTFGYDPDSLLTQAGALTLTRDPQHGLLTGTALGALTDTRSYSTFGELSSYRAAVGPAELLSIQYTRDSLGRITQKTETLSGVTDTFDYIYDVAGRLTEVRKNGALIAGYGYDANSNRTSRTTPGGTVTGTYDAQDRLLAYGDATYTYTANGELASKTTPAGTTTYLYDVAGNLLAGTLPDGTRIDYLIDGRNRRIGKKVNGVLIQGFLYRDQLKPVAELDGAGNVVARFVYGSSPLVPDYLIKGTATYRILSDHLSSPRLVVDATSGAIVQRLDYDEFGSVTLDTNPGFQPFGFAGGLHDLHTKFTHFGARDYDAETGRWTAKDLIRFTGGDSNLYGYVLQDPINEADPSGLESFTFSAYVGVGFTIQIGREAGDNFFRLGFGVGAGGGLSFQPDGDFPTPPGLRGCPRDSQGSSASVGLQIGNLSYDASWESGLLWYTDKDGSLRTVYHERSTPLALSFTKKFDVGIGGYFNPFEFGWAGY